MNRLLFCLVLLVAPLVVRAQKSAAKQPKQQAIAEAADSGKVYTYVEQMPELMGGGGLGAIVSTFQRGLRFPHVADEGETRWSRLAVSFVVNTEGHVQNIAVTSSSNNPVIDNAMVAAVRGMPRFTPGYQAGKAVAVRLTLPISCIKPQ